MTDAKIQENSQIITPFSGISFISDEILRCGFSLLIDRLSGYR
jgi:hypothetical protein